MYHLRMRKILEGKQIMTAEKLQLKSHCVYPPEIIRTSSLGRLQKKIIGNTMTAFMQHLHCNRESGNPQPPISLVCKITFKQIAEVLKCYSNAFKRHWNNTETISFNIIFQI